MGGMTVWQVTQEVNGSPKAVEIPMPASKKSSVHADRGAHSKGPFKSAFD